jgi:hypothetical protein
MAVPRHVDHQSVGKFLREVDSKVADNVAQVATADGSDPATTQALANALKTSHNAVLTALKEAGIMVADE